MVRSGPLGFQIERGRDRFSSFPIGVGLLIWEPKSDRGGSVVVGYDFPP